MKLRPSLLVLIGCAALCAAVYLVFLLPMVRELTALRREATYLNARLIGTARLSSDLNDARSAVCTVRLAHRAIRDRFVTESNREIFITEVLRCAEDAGVEIRQVRPAPARTAPDRDLLPVELSAESGLRNLVALLHSLEKLNRPCVIERITVHGEGSPGKHPISILLGVYLLRENLGV